MSQLPHTECTFAYGLAACTCVSAHLVLLACAHASCAAPRPARCLLGRRWRHSALRPDAGVLRVLWVVDRCCSVFICSIFVFSSAVVVVKVSGRSTEYGLLHSHPHPHGRTRTRTVLKSLITSLSSSRESQWNVGGEMTRAAARGPHSSHGTIGPSPPRPSHPHRCAPPVLAPLLHLHHYHPLRRTMTSCGQCQC
jgi:hypothetical protein